MKTLNEETEEVKNTSHIHGFLGLEFRKWISYHKQFID